MINVCKKGKQIERDLANFLKDRGCPSARRTEQHNGSEGLSDVVADELSLWHIESKGIRNPKLPKSTLKKWMEQITKDCPRGLKPVIFVKSNNRRLIALFTITEIKSLRYASGNFMVVAEESFNPTAYIEKALITEKVQKALFDNNGEFTHIPSFWIEEGSMFFAMDADEALAAMLTLEVERKSTKAEKSQSEQIEFLRSLQCRGPA